MRKPSPKLLYTFGLATLIAGGVVIAAAGDGQQQRTKVHVFEHSSDCKGEECNESKDSERTIIIQCLGDGCEDADLAQHVSIGVEDIADHHKSGFRWSSDEDDHFNFALHGLFSGPSGFLGVELNELSPELRAHFGVPDDVGVMVSKVVADSPAAKAGIQVGDIISGVDGEDITSGGKLAREIRSREEGETVDLEIWRDGHLERVTAGVEMRQASSRLPRVFAHHGKHGDGKRIEIRRLHADHDEFDFDCGSADDCTVIVKCQDGSCDCKVNGDPVDCDTIPGVDLQGD